MAYALTIGICGCIKTWDLGIAALITEDSSRYPTSAGYDPIITENELYILPENSTEMSDLGTKISEMAEAPAVTDMDYFVGIKQSGDTYANYRYSLTDILQASRKQITLSEGDLSDSDGDGNYSTVTVDWLNGRAIAAVASDDLYYLADLRFNQTGDSITGIGIKFYVGQKIVLYL